MLLHKSVSAPFLSKTYELVNHPSTENVVSRSNDNHTTFVMWSPSELVRDLLPNYFKHNFSSFIRQLNTYGFRKIVPEQWEFANKYFREGKKHQLCQIQRNKMLVNARTHIVGGSGIATSQLQSPTTADDHEWSPLSSLPWPLPAPMLALVLALSDNNERRRNWMLASQELDVGVRGDTYAKTLQRPSVVNAHAREAALADAAIAHGSHCKSGASGSAGAWAGS